MIDLPIKFDQLVKMPGDAGGTGYPYRISAKDLMSNFEYAALDADDSWIESTGTSTGQGRKLKLPALPTGGTYALACVDGDLEWIEDDAGGGGASGTFLASLVDGNISVTSGSYHILNTNTPVLAMSGSGQFVYAIIEHSNAGIFQDFRIEISSVTKDPTNLDGTGKFVKFSNVLLATRSGDTMLQHRVGNFSLVHQVVSGHICLWAYSSGGTALP